MHHCSAIVAQAVETKGAQVVAATQTTESRRPVKSQPLTPQRQKRVNRGGSTTPAVGKRGATASTTTTTTGPSSWDGTLQPWESSQMSFCATRNISVLPLDRIQRGVFVTHSDRQGLQKVEAAEADHRRDIVEAMLSEYEDGFTFLSGELRRMHANVLETRAEMVSFERHVRRQLIAEEENARVPISHERCRCEYSYKYLEQILKRGSIIEDDMKRERKMTHRSEEQQRKWLLQQHRTVRSGIAKKEAANIRYMNIQAACFAKAASHFHQVVYDAKLERAQSRQSTRSGGAFSPMTTMDYYAAGCHSPDDVENDDSLPQPRPFSPIHIDDGGGIDGDGTTPTKQYIPTNDLVSSIISPMSPMAGTGKHSLKRTQYIQEFLASRPALYTKKDYTTHSPSRTADTTGSRAVTPAARPAVTHSSDWSSTRAQGSGAPRASTSYAKRNSTFDRGGGSMQRVTVDTSSLAPVIPYWLFRRTTVMDLHRAVHRRLDAVLGADYLPFPPSPKSSTVDAVQAEPSPATKLRLLQKGLEDAEAAEAEGGDPQAILISIELALTAASVLCTKEDPQRSIVLVSESLMKLDAFVGQQPEEECGPLFFKLFCVALHNAAMALSMLPEEITGGGSSVNSDRLGAGRRASSRRSTSRAADDALGRRVTPVEMMQLAVEMAASAFGLDCPFTRHLQTHALANVVQMHVLPPMALPPPPPDSRSQSRSAIGTRRALATRAATAPLK